MTHSHFFETNVSYNDLTIQAKHKTDKTVYIIRGVPGTGKSTLINQILHCHFPGQRITPNLKRRHIVSNDDYFTWLKFQGQQQQKKYTKATQQQLQKPHTQKYKFDPSGFAPGQNNVPMLAQNKIKTLMSEKVTPIIVDNTHTADWELMPIFGLARYYGYNIHIREIDARKIWVDGKQSENYKTYRHILDQRKARIGKDIPQNVLWGTQADPPKRPNRMPGMIQKMQTTLKQTDQNKQNYERNPKLYAKRIAHTTKPPFAKLTQQAQQGLQQLKKQTQKQK
jgi:hypothetical protein